MLGPDEAKILNNLVQAGAVVVAGLYFFFRWSRGWLYSNLSLTSQTLRQTNNESSELDDVVLTVVLQKGGRANANLTELIVKTIQLSGESFPSSEQSIDISAPSKSRNLNIPPGETVQFDVYFIVPKTSVVRFDTLAISKTASWKTSIVSLPIKINQSQS